MNRNDRFGPIVSVILMFGGCLLVFLKDENLHALGWFCLTVCCLFAVGTIRDWAERKKWLWLLMIPPGIVLAYEAWFILRKLAVGLYREWYAFSLFAWILLTLYLWQRGNNYKEEVEMLRKSMWRDENQT